VSPEQASNPGIYGQLVQQLQTIDTQLQNYQEQASQLAELTRKKQATLLQIEAQRTDISQKRDAFLTQVFSGRTDLKITLVKFGDEAEAKRTLRDVLQRHDVSPELDDLVRKLFELEVTVERLRQFKLSLKNAAAVGDRHAAFEGVVLSKPLCNHLGKRTTEDWARLDAWFPPDNLRIKVSRDGETAPNVDLGRASPGQVATAVLAFLLAYGDQPLILDQPEDDLDNEMIFKIIVRELRRNKRRRQVILITHNPNLVVNANADMIFPLQSSRGPTRLPHAGTLQNPEVRNAVCSVMEGGKRALAQRFRRMV
jgi:DNA repair exonuclease SbcCD ATPase subunit